MKSILTAVHGVYKVGGQLFTDHRQFGQRFAQLRLGYIVHESVTCSAIVLANVGGVRTQRPIDPTFEKRPAGVVDAHDVGHGRVAGGVGRLRRVVGLTPGFGAIVLVEQYRKFGVEDGRSKLRPRRLLAHVDQEVYAAGALREGDWPIEKICEPMIQFLSIKMGNLNNCYKY
uniref:Uncharacterized protein n=1 Tax=Romanomermis culicivorax TaxID=13658 RepID=A0A915L124_ROMCU